MPVVSPAPRSALPSSALASPLPLSGPPLHPNVLRGRTKQLTIRLEIQTRDGVLLSLRDVSTFLGKSHSYVKQQLRNPDHALYELARYVVNVNSAGTKPSWRIRLGDLEAWIQRRPRMVEA